MISRDLGRKARVALGIEAGRNAGEVAMAVVFLLSLGVLSWGILGFATGAARTGLLALLLS